MKLTQEIYQVRITKTIWGNFIEDDIYKVGIYTDETDSEEYKKRLLMGKISKEITDIEYQLISKVLL
jgi:hypothetical protein